MDYLGGCVFYFLPHKFLLYRFFCDFWRSRDYFLFGFSHVHHAKPFKLSKSVLNYVSFWSWYPHTEVYSFLPFFAHNIGHSMSFLMPSSCSGWWFCDSFQMATLNPEPWWKHREEMPASSNEPKKPCIATSSSFQFFIAVRLCWYGLLCPASSHLQFPIPFYYRPAMNKLSLHHLHGLAGFCPVSGSPLPDDPHTRFYSQLQSVTGQVTSGITHHCHWDPILMGTPERILGLVRHWEDAIWIPRKKTVAFLRGIHWTGFFLDTRAISRSRLDCMKCFVVEILCCYLFCCHVYSTSIFHLTLFTLTCFDFTNIYDIMRHHGFIILSYFGVSAKTPLVHIGVKNPFPDFMKGTRT